ncbi:hypothetical protein [Anaerosacchariphilus polymeriproducens]|uniref:Lipoprotein n=1 Tax=Anaerosacchariphilus polymeriproducens TaxID=1812858 RepID=A0A371AXF7_9FIRM|nr:hypothetical protein [Anaerosacchariphilus polymeriproducens]RDU24202.1 hypothetical protein DWV06_05755 [Anaerosacchariphilus polymeriproducens]
MNHKFNKIIFVIVNIIFISILFSSCSSKNTANKVDDIKQKIVFIQQYINYSDGYVNRGFFIDNKGNKVSYDLTSEDKKYNDIKEVLSYLENYQYNTSESSISQTDLLKYYNLIYKIDLNYKVEEKSFGADRGSDCLYGVRYASNNSAILVLINETGDWEKNNTDRNAVKIKEGLR